MTGGLVLMDDSFICDAIQHARAGLINLLGRSFIAGGDRFLDLFERGAQLRTQRSVVLALFFGLTGAFTCLNCIGHAGVGSAKRAILAGERTWRKVDSRRDYAPV